MAVVAAEPHGRAAAAGGAAAEPVAEAVSLRVEEGAGFYFNEDFHLLDSIQVMVDHKDATGNALAQGWWT